jgi:hypothetical protein
MGNKPRHMVTATAACAVAGCAPMPELPPAMPEPPLFPLLPPFPPFPALPPEPTLPPLPLFEPLLSPDPAEPFPVAVSPPLPTGACRRSCRATRSGRGYRSTTWRVK